jgi:4-hydroxymandelate oxidase
MAGTGPGSDETVEIDLSRLEADAAVDLDPSVYAYVSGGAGESPDQNLVAWRHYRIRPRMLRDVHAVSTAVSVLGQMAVSPIMVAPTAMHRLVCPEGELATARAAARAGATYVVSAVATTAIEDIAEEVPNAPRWMQAYMMRDRGLTRAMLERAAAAGCSAVVLTVDSPGIPYARRGAVRPLNRELRLPNLLPHEESPDVLVAASNYARDLTFDDLARIRGWTGLPLVVKGVLRGDDAVRCVEAGADAIAVSNHGGRHVPDCISTAMALPEVADAVAGRRDVYVDGGIRTGASILKALALGATAVMIGRPVVWGLAIRGEAGAFAVLEALRIDLERLLALCGVADVRDATRDLVVPGGGSYPPGNQPREFLSDQNYLYKQF